MKTSPKRPVDPQRRRFFRRMVAEILSVCEEIGGRPQLKIHELSQLPDTVLRNIVPVAKANQPTKIEGDQLLYYNCDTRAYKMVCRLSPEQKQFILSMDGRRTLDQLARKVAQACRLDPSKAYAIVKALFCRLARIGVCIPKGAHLDRTPGIADQKEIPG